MKGTKDAVDKYTEKGKDNQVYICVKEESKEGRTLQQNKVFYRLFNGISSHLGYNTDEVKSFLLAGTFGTHKMKLNTEEIEVPNESRTSKLTKEQGIFFIETILAFVKMKDIPIEITPREITSLYDSFNN